MQNIWYHKSMSVREAQVALATDFFSTNPAYGADEES